MYIFLYLLYWNSIYMVETIIISTVVVKGLINIQIMKMCVALFMCGLLCVYAVRELHSKEQLGPIIYRNIL